MKFEHLKALNQARAERRAIALVTDLADGAQRLVRVDEGHWLS